MVMMMKNIPMMNWVLRWGNKTLMLVITRSSSSSVADERFFYVYTLEALTLALLVVAAVGKCSANQIYEECGSPCIKTCSNPEYSCSSHCTYGCFCPEGIIFVFIIKNLKDPCKYFWNISIVKWKRLLEQ